MTVAIPPEVHDSRVQSRFCGASKRQGEGTCTRPAGWGTDHVGAGRCKLHGGLSPVRSGRYSTVKREGLRDLIATHEADPDPLNILPELGAARALFQDFIERYDEWRDAVVAWHASFGDEYRDARKEWLEEHGGACEACKGSGRKGAEPEPNPLDYVNKPREVLDISDAYRIVSEVTKIVQRIEDIRAKNAVSRPELHRIVSEMWRVVELHVGDGEQRGRIREGWLSGIRL